MTWPARPTEGLHPIYAEWNDDPAGGLWTGFEDLIQQMVDGEPDVEGPGVDARTPYQQTALRHLRSVARRRHYRALRTERHGLALLWYRFERDQ